MIDAIKDKIGEEIKKDEMDQSHRLGATKNNCKNRPIIINLALYKTSCRTFKNKTNIKGTNSVPESLTKSVWKLLKKLEKNKDFRKYRLVKESTLWFKSMLRCIIEDHQRKESPWFLWSWFPFLFLLCFGVWIWYWFGYLHQKDIKKSRNLYH